MRRAFVALLAPFGPEGGFLGALCVLFAVQFGVADGAMAGAEALKARLQAQHISLHAFQITTQLSKSHQHDLAHAALAGVLFGQTLPIDVILLSKFEDAERESHAQQLGRERGEDRR